jgi:uncharacterized protein YebE (UPF0316 family)
MEPCLPTYLINNTPMVVSISFRRNDTELPSEGRNSGLSSRHCIVFGLETSRMMVP